LLYDFGGRSAQIESATELVVAAAAGQDAMLQNAFATVVETYFAVATNTVLAGVAQVAIENAQRILAAALVREKLGAATKADSEYARLGVAQATLAASRIDEQLQLSKGDLATALHLEPDTRITLASGSADQELQTEYFNGRTADKISALIRNIESHPQIRAATARANSAKAQVAAAGSEHMPKLTMAGNYYLNGRPGSSVTSTPSTEKFVGLSLAVPMFDGFSTLNRIKAAQSQHQRSLAQLADTRGQVKSAIWRAHQSSVLSVKSLKAGEASVRSANAAKNQARTRYQDGAGDIADWLRAEKSYFEARVDVIRAQSEIRLARLRLIVALGDLGSWAFEQSSTGDRADFLVRKQIQKNHSQRAPAQGSRQKNI
jgi:outer membrane protein